MKKDEKKTPSYIRRAVKNYELSKDRITAMAPIGTKKRIQDVLKSSGYDSVSAFAVSAILEKLEALERSGENETDL